MDLEAVCDRISYLEGLRDDIEDELDELYRERQDYWEIERQQALVEYERSALL